MPTGCHSHTSGTSRGTSRVGVSSVRKHWKNSLLEEIRGRPLDAPEAVATMTAVGNSNAVRVSRVKECIKVPA